jgi:uncharacterized metal-binding protein YceD (DUF177 family)
MWINLLEIPDEGKTFVCNRHTAELNEVLSDLVGDIPHTAEFSIKPMQGGTFELQGFIKTEAPEQCSRCGIDIRCKLSENFKELMLPELDQPRNAKYSKPNHFSEMTNEDFSVVEYRGHRFNVGEYLHEIIGLALPLIPAPPENEKGDCTVCHKAVKDMKFEYVEDFKEKPESPFSILKGIKLN